MKPILLLSTLLLLVATGCSRAPDPVPTVQEPQPKWAAPVQTDMEVYINQYSLSPRQGVVGRLNLEEWHSDIKPAAAFSTNQEGHPPYKVRLEYKGTESNRDHYTVTITQPDAGTMKTIVKGVVYSGKEVELFRDHDYRIGMRPRTDE